jgi:nucleotide-binding universal stress UspA family protein
MSLDVTRRKVVAAVDGSEDALEALLYLSLMYSPKLNLEVQLLYILPSLPPILVADQDRQSKLRLLDIERKNVQMAERIMAEAKGILLKKGFQEDNIKGVYRKKQIGIARDICTFTEAKGADALLITKRGRSRLEAFFSGEISSKIVAYCHACPVWVVEGAVESQKVLIGVDTSENSLRAVNHAGLMLSGTQCKITLFHSKRHLRRFVPQEVIEAAPEFEELWRNKAEEQIGPQMKKAQHILLEAGLREDQITTKTVDGSRSAASDILKEARSSDCGTIILGRRGVSGVREFFPGSVTSKVIQGGGGMAVWVVH